MKPFRSTGALLVAAAVVLLTGHGLLSGEAGGDSAPGKLLKQAPAPDGEAYSLDQLAPELAKILKATQDQEPAQGGPLPWQPSGSTNLFLTVPGLYPNFSSSSTNMLSSKLPKPGIYEAHPYTMIVIVPGPQPDDKCIVSASRETDRNMPIIRPQIELVPRKPK
ncbi:MAG: hypothetical protein C5B50_29145 [Verrucomicrobia bacterium]|nr:MAG: hypothetical protein C5B50_29145 [Verrucomicrobiota bacterium]